MVTSASRIRLFAVMCVACAGAGCASTPTSSTVAVPPTPSSVDSVLRLSLWDGIRNRGLPIWESNGRVIRIVEDLMPADAPFPSRDAMTHLDPLTGASLDAGDRGHAPDDVLVPTTVTKNEPWWMQFDVVTGTHERDCLQLALPADAFVPAHPSVRQVELWYLRRRFISSIADGEPLLLRFRHDGTFLGVHRSDVALVRPVPIIEILNDHEKGAHVGWGWRGNAHLVPTARTADGRITRFDVDDPIGMQLDEWERALRDARRAYDPPVHVAMTVLGQAPQYAVYAEESRDPSPIEWLLQLDDDAQYPGVPSVRQIRFGFDHAPFPKMMFPGTRVILEFDSPGNIVGVQFPP